MNVIWDNAVLVQYGFVYLSPVDGEDADLDESRRGQTNGLLGAAVRGAITFVTGLHTGHVPLRIEWYDYEPPVDSRWEDVVEASLEVQQHQMRLASFEDAHVVTMPAIGPHRVRLCVAGMDRGANEEVQDGGLAPDRYLLQLWPAPMAADQIVRMGSRQAAYWHDQAQLSDRGAGTGAVADEEEDDDDWSPYSIDDREVLHRIPSARWAEAAVRLARMACEHATVDRVEPVRTALRQLDRGYAVAPLGAPRELLERLMSALATTGHVAPHSSRSQVAAAITAVTIASSAAAHRQVPFMQPPQGAPTFEEQALLDVLVHARAAAGRDENGIVDRLLAEMASS